VSTRYSKSRIDDDWMNYSHILDRYNWFLDTHDSKLLYSKGNTQTRRDINLSYPERISSDSPIPMQSDNYNIGSISDFAGSIEVGELIPLQADTTVVCDDGLLTVTDSSVTFSPVEAPKGASHLQEHLINVTQLRKTRTIPDIELNFPNAPETFVVRNNRCSTVSCTADGGISDPAEPVKYRKKDMSASDTIEPNSAITGDAIDLIQRIEGESIQLACFSPPYNIGKDYGDYDDNVPIEDWYGMMKGVFGQLFRALEPDGKVVVNIGKSFGNSDKDGRFFFYPLASYVKDIAIDVGFDFWDEAIWQKRGFHGRGGGPLMGSYPDPTNMMITQTHEQILVFRKWVNEEYFSNRELPEVGSEKRQQSKLTKERWRETTQSIWDVQAVKQSNLDVEHNAVYPEEIPKRAIQLYSFKGDTVLDPFCGTGTTLVSAKKAGRSYIGFDIEQDYIKHTKGRLEETKFDDKTYVQERDT